MEKPIATTRSATGIPTGRLAVWWVLASEIVIFGGLLMAYLIHRIGHPEWASDLNAGSTVTSIGAFNTFVLLTSSLSAVLAHDAAEHNDGKKASKFLWFTILGAAIFLVVKAFEWGGKFQAGIGPSTSGFWGFYFIAAGIHALHVIAGAILMVWVAGLAKKGQELQRVELIGIYWHFVDLVWIFLFPLLYIAK